MKRIFLLLAALAMFTLPAAAQKTETIDAILARTFLPQPGIVHAGLAPAMAPPQFLTRDQILNQVFDPASKSLKATATAGSAGAPPARFLTGDQIFNQAFDPITKSLKLLCVSGCSGESSPPRLDQVLDPAAPVDFTMGAHFLRLDSTDQTVTGVTFISRVVHSSDVNASLAVLGNCELMNSAGTPYCTGISGSAQLRGSGGATFLAGVYGAVLGDGSGTAIEAASLYADTPALFPGIINIGYGLFINDQTGATTNYAIKTGLGQNSFGDRLTVKSNTAAIQSATFTGAGLNDATSGGTYTGTSDLAYCVQIDASVPSPDTFEWGTGGSCSNGATGVGITGAAQNLSNDVQITFAAIDGHTIGDNWTFTAYAPIPLTLQDHSGNITFRVKETGTVNVGGSDGITDSGTTCTITAITGGIITGATCTP